MQERFEVEKQDRLRHSEAALRLHKREPFLRPVGGGHNALFQEPSAAAIGGDLDAAKVAKAAVPKLHGADEALVASMSQLNAELSLAATREASVVDVNAVLSGLPASKPLVVVRGKRE